MQFAKTQINGLKMNFKCLEFLITIYEQVNLIFAKQKSPLE